MATHENVNSIKNVKSLDWMESILGFFDGSNDIISTGRNESSGFDWFRFHNWASFDSVFRIVWDIKQRMIDSNFNMIIFVFVVGRKIEDCLFS